MNPLTGAPVESGYGTGVVWWPELDPLCRPGEGLVHVVEVEPETFWVPCDGQPLGFKSRVARALGHLPQPKLLHGVGAPFGGSVPQSKAHRETLACDIAALQPGWISDHLSFNQFTPPGAGDGDTPVSTGFFLPPAQCPDGVAIAAEQLRQRHASTGVPVAFEIPVSYLPARPGEMSDGAFVARVAEAADCGILLDLHNLLCNARNGRQTVEAFFKEIPLHRVWEIHVAGGERAGKLWLDAHCGLVEPELMAIVAEIVPQLPNLCAINFEILPDYIASIGLAPIGRLLGELNEIWATRGQNAGSRRGRAAAVPVLDGADAITSAMWECALGAAVVGIPEPDLPAAFRDWVRRAEGPLGLYRMLANETRASSLVETTPRTIRTILRHRKEAGTRELLGRFWRQAAPAYTIVQDSRAFLDFVAAVDLALPGLDADIASDRALLDQLTSI